jgi:hypothetical protein
MCHTLIFSKAEVRVELGYDCDGESFAGAALYKFGELVEVAEADDVVSKVAGWIEYHRP